MYTKEDKVIIEYNNCPLMQCLPDLTVSLTVQDLSMRNLK